MRLVARGLGLALAVWTLPAAAQDVAISLAPGEVLLKVEAEGTHRTAPDVMTITAGVVTTETTARRALAANNELATRLVEAVRAQGIQPRDVQTSELSIVPQLEQLSDEAAERAERENRRPRILGYVATNNLEIRLRDLSRAPDIMDALFSAGANSVQGPRFSLAEPRPAERLARHAAVAAAREEAETYAEALNMRVVRVLRVSERGDFDWEGGEVITVTGSRIRRMPIEPGELTTRINLWIDYALAPR